MRHGSLRSSVLMLRAVDGQGRALQLGTTMRKDNTGLDLKQLFIGARQCPGQGPDSTMHDWRGAGGIDGKR